MTNLSHAKLHFFWPVEDQFPSWIDRFARLLANASHGLDHVGTQVGA